MQIEKVTAIGFSLIVEDSENELIIQTSAGQSGYVALQAIATSVDGGCASRCKSYWSVPYGEQTEEGIQKVIAAVVWEWGAPEEQAQAVARLWRQRQDDHLDGGQWESVKELFNGHAKTLK